MQATVRSSPRGAQLEADPAALASPLELECRVCELETENARLRLLVGELLVVNQRLRDNSRALQTSSLEAQRRAG